MPHVVQVSNQNFLWLTKGKTWEFRFLSKCDLLHEHIDEIYKPIFLKDEGRNGYWNGKIRLGDTNYFYVAGRRFGYERLNGETVPLRDRAARPIPHDMLLLCNSQDEMQALLRCQWDEHILRGVWDSYIAFYGSPSHPTTPIEIKFDLNLDVLPVAPIPTDKIVHLDVELKGVPPLTRYPKEPFPLKTPKPTSSPNSTPILHTNSRKTDIHVSEETLLYVIFIMLPLVAFLIFILVVELLFIFHIKAQLARYL